MSLRKTSFAALSGVMFLGACASQPLGPTVQVMPNPNKPFQIFQQEQAECKQYADSQTAGQADSANQRAVGAALLGTALGAGLGAAVGGGQGAGVGAGAGAIVGTGVGAQNSGGSQQGIQQQYDNAYMQCMYSKGNQVPGMTIPVAAPAPALPPIQHHSPTTNPPNHHVKPSNAPPPPSDAPPPPQ